MAHKPTMKQQIQKLGDAARQNAAHREELWEALFDLLEGRISGNAARAVLDRNTFCSCGARASCWDGKHWKLCETCRSS